MAEIEKIFLAVVEICLESRTALADCASRAIVTRDGVGNESRGVAAVVIEILVGNAVAATANLFAVAIWNRGVVKEAMVSESHVVVAGFENRGAVVISSHDMAAECEILV